MTMPESLRRMFDLCAAGETPMVEELLRQDADLAKSSWGYFSPLHVAVREGHLDTVTLLLRYGADAADKPVLSWQDSLPQMAQDRGYVAIAELLREHLQHTYQVQPIGDVTAGLIRAYDRDELLAWFEQHPETIHAGDERGNTPLHWAVLTRQTELIDLLLARGADIQAQRADGSQAVHLAMEGDYFYRGNRDLPTNTIRDQRFLLGYLIGKGTPFDIFIASAVGDAIRVKEQLAQNPQLANARDTSGRSALYYAAKHGHIEVVRSLLTGGADPNLPERDASGGAALYAAVRGDHAECVKLLLAHGANPSAEIEASGNAVYAAMQKGAQELLELLYEHGGTVTMSGACALGRIDLVGEMLALNPAAANDGDYGPLSQAVSCGYANIVKLLLRHHVELNGPWYASNHMVYACNNEMVELLLRHDADPNVRNWLGISYLHLTAKKGDTELADLLLRYGADLDAVDEEYNTTPLGWAAKYGQAEMAAYLLRKGAAIEPADVPEWASPLAWARRRGHQAIADLLLSHRRGAV
ncbi:ankyrin repeat domain-containing protein [Paenibacillus lignilyticus]|uniref:Ankyrin repeat domain-containing protein n=1 Tax=Paenibacillus lignilyticus TaxID=1172615 RepID=A0ABS5CGB2_9BACL|nr:ankyrin repeat domain-containing protein [Paenibacillus lignilyticus]MBP3964920.1 ankyrin repeat domain-containing protein [Paenibacillus lignilyticus]